MSLLVKVLAAAGDLDHTFSGDGRQNTNFGGNEGANAVAIQSDGKVVAAGYASSPSTVGDFALTRYKTNGVLDTTFSGDGKQTTDLGGDDQAYAIAIQSDGKIVVAGYTSGSTGYDFALARYKTDGSLDTSFSGDGIQTTDFSGGDDQAFAIAIQANGKIVVAGTAATNSSNTDRDFALARYNKDGTPDTTFSGDGMQTTDFGSADQVNALAIQANGRIVAAGIANNFYFVLARYKTNGALDTTFSGDGKQDTIFFGGASGATGVAIQADGKIVAAGYTFNGDYNFALVRYKGNGNLDTTFDGDGKQTTDFFSGSGDFGQAVAIQPDQKIVVAGVANPNINTKADFAVARYNTDGSLDMTFSGDGMKTTGFFSHSNDYGRAVAIQSDGNIVVAGYTIGSTAVDFALARYLGS